ECRLSPGAHHRRRHFPLHDALPIYAQRLQPRPLPPVARNGDAARPMDALVRGHDEHRVYAAHLDDPFAHHAGHVLRMTFWAAYADRKSTRLNSSHVKISYAVSCLKK